MSQSRLWAITSYFDAFASRHRLPVYREFRRRLAVPLVTVELSFGGDFHLQPEDADILIRRSDGSVLWQKERLLNLALRALPAHVEAVAWLDCDIVFLREDWPEALLQHLQDFEMVQPFRRLYYHDRGECVEDYPISLDGALESVAFQFTQGKLPEEAYKMPGMFHKLRYMTGAAWAARRELLEAHGFYDTAVLGGGDKLMFSAAAGRFDRIARWMSPAHQRHFSDWAKPFADSVKRRISYIEGDLVHLWHGDVGARHYSERRVGFEEFQFDPRQDLALTQSRVWRWNSDKLGMQAFVREQLSRLVPPVTV